MIELEIEPFSMKIYEEDLHLLEVFCRNRSLNLDKDDFYYYTDRITTYCFVNIDKNEVILEDIFDGKMIYNEISISNFKTKYRKEFNQ